MIIECQAAMEVTVKPEESMRRRSLVGSSRPNQSRNVAPLVAASPNPAPECPSTAPLPPANSPPSPQRRSWRPMSLPTAIGVTLASSPPTVVQIKTRMPSESQSNRFLVALAAQERRVLELKEELHQAEVDLAKLKSQWALCEAKRKPEDVAHLSQAQRTDAVLTTTEVDGGTDGPVSRLSNEQERRRAAGERPRLSQRTAIAGQKHTRALSLLSSERLNLSQTPTQRSVPVALVDLKETHPTKTPATLQAPVNLSTVKSTRIETRRPKPGQRPPSEIILRTGLQMAEGFKEGLWTFLDDLRQVVVDEQVPNRRPSQANVPTTPKNGTRPASKRVTPSSKTHISMEKMMQTQSFRTDTATGPPITTGGVNGGEDITDPTTMQQEEQGRKGSTVSQLTNASSEDNEIWDSWDSPMHGQPERRFKVPYQ